MDANFNDEFEDVPIIVKKKIMNHDYEMYVIRKMMRFHFIGVVKETILGKLLYDESQIEEKQRLIQNMFQTEYEEDDEIIHVEYMLSS